MSHYNENLFEKLESNNKDVVEGVKHLIREQFSKVNEPWLINGLYEYYLNTNSVRGMELLITLKEPHQQYLFDKLYESIKNRKTELKVRVQALTLLGHIARSQPSWIYQLPEHPLFKELLTFLKNEVELLPLISALLVLIVLLPMFPSSIGEQSLNNIFDIFRRLAAWNSHVSGNLVQDQMIHLQVALYALFLRLYGMYPCNFLSYLGSHFKDKNNPVFRHTIKPMMDTVKMHPSLVTMSKETETTTERWKKMDVHDVIVECERFSLDITDRCPHETCQNTTEFRSRSGTINSTVGGGVPNLNESSYQQQNIKSLASLPMAGSKGGFFSPSQIYEVQTPPITETMGVSHRNMQGVINRCNYPQTQEGSPPEAAIEATPETTPIRDFTAATPPRPLTPKTNVARALTSFRANPGGIIVGGTPTNSVPSSPMRKEPSPFVFPTRVEETTRGISLSQHLVYRLSQERQSSEVQLVGSKPPPSSPLKIVNPETAHRQRIESPTSREDEEVSLISVSAEKYDHYRRRTSRHLESLLPETDAGEKDLEQGSPCSSGGLGIPNSKSLNNLKKRIRRITYHSECYVESKKAEMSTGSSPGIDVLLEGISTVRKVNSLPDIKRFEETDEEAVSSEDHGSNTSNGVENGATKQKCPQTSSSTQTDVLWPMPYEHLFINIFPSMKDESMEIKPSPAPSPAPVLNQAVEQYKPSLYDILDKYIEKCVASADNNSLRDQLQLVHQQLLFEKYRRETHAYRNRRLLSDAKSTRSLEEYNSALRDQVQLEQKEIDDLRKQLVDTRREFTDELTQLTASLQFMQDKCKNLSDENTTLKEANRKLEADVSTYKMKCNSLDKERQHAEAALLDALAEGKVAREQALVGDKVKLELQRVNRELLLMGELHVKYKQRMDGLPSMKQVDEEISNISEAYREEVKAMQHALEAKTASIDASRSRILELEHIVSAKDEIIVAQKRTLVSVNEEREAMLEAIESKYQTQLAINRTLEEKILELRQKLESEVARRKMHSPDTSSCHEVQVTTTAGLSPHSSPLSVSLASSEGSAAFQDREMRN